MITVYRVDHSKIKIISMRGHVISSIYYKFQKKTKTTLGCISHTMQPGPQTSISQFHVRCRTKEADDKGSRQGSRLGFRHGSTMVRSRLEVSIWYNLSEKNTRYTNLRITPHLYCRAVLSFIPSFTLLLTILNRCLSYMDKIPIM